MNRRPGASDQAQGSGGVQPAVEARNLAAAYQDRLIWSDASFTVAAGEFVAVLGPNGAGKSTLLKVLLGLLPPRLGSVRVLGLPPARGNPQIGYVPQARSLDPQVALRGLDLVELGMDGHRWGMRLPGAGARARRDRARAAVAAVGALAYAGRRLGQLSGGERQRLLLAQALVGEPRLLLMDEPLANLDVRSQAGMAELVGRLARERGLAVLIVAHDLNPLRRVIDRVCYVAGGRLAIGNPDEVISSQVLSQLYGAPVEVLVDSRGRRFVVGIEQEPAHPHPPEMAEASSSGWY